MYLPSAGMIVIIKFILICEIIFFLSENFRSLNLDGEGRPVHVSDYEKDIMSKIINKLKFKYDPLNIENPKLQVSD